MNGESSNKIEDNPEYECMVDNKNATVNFLDLKIKRFPKNRMIANLAAEKLTYMREPLKAMSQFKTMGIAPMSLLVKKLITKKFAMSIEAPTWPSLE